jgi:hypothetical protein
MNETGYLSQQRDGIWAERKGFCPRLGSNQHSIGWRRGVVGYSGRIKEFIAWFRLQVRLRMWVVMDGRGDNFTVKQSL